MKLLRGPFAGPLSFLVLLITCALLSANAIAQEYPDVDDVGELEPEDAPEEIDFNVDDPMATPPDDGHPRIAADIDEITVTANRREENLQDAAISVTALDGNFIEEVGLSNFGEIQRFTPNLQIIPQTDSRSTSIKIRGIGSVGSNAGVDPSVAVFIDGVYQGRAGMSIQDLIDVEAVEVLRGPQGTLYGKNTAAGAIVVTTRKPTYEPSAMLEFVGGNYKTLEGRFTGNLPLVDDVLATRLTGYGVTRDGYETNEAEMWAGDDINGSTRWGLRSSTVWDVNDRLSFLLTGDYAERIEECCAGDIIEYGEVAPNPILSSATEIAAGQGITLPPAIPGDRLVSANVLPRNDVTVAGVALDGTLDLWEHTFTWLTAWRNFKSDSLFDGDFSEIDALLWDTNVDYNQASTELRAVSPPYRWLDYVGGLYFFYSETKTYDVLTFTDGYIRNSTFAALAPPTGNAQQANTGDNKHGTLSVAGYADANINVAELWGGTPDISFTGGIRVGWEEKSHDGSQISRGTLTDALCPQPPGPFDSCLETAINGEDAFSDQSESDTYVTGRAILRYKPTEDIMMYASYATGYKSGGYNQLRTAGQGDDEAVLWFEPENSGSVEVGLRTSWLDNMVTFNITGYYTNYDDFQAQIFDGLGIRMDNAGNFISTGFEADLTIVPLPGWITVLGVGYVHTEYKDFPNGPCTVEQQINQPNPDCVNGFQDLEGRRLDGTPNWDITVFSSYEDELPLQAVDLNWYGLVSFNYQTWRYLNASLDPNLEADPFALLGLRVGLRHPEGTWDLSAFVNNVTDDNYWVAGFDVPTLGGYAGFIAPPRTFGGTLRVRF